MPPTHRVRPPLRRVVAGDDSGFTIVEALVSFVILAVVAAATVVAIVNATRTSKLSTDRVTAANLAQQDLQAARSLQFPTYPQAKAAAATKIGSTNYMLSRTVTVMGASGTSAGSCPTTPDFTNQPYMVVTTTVTWPPAGKLDRVVVSTEIAC